VIKKLIYKQLKLKQKLKNNNTVNKFLMLKHP